MNRYLRIATLPAGRAMAVTDLHGDWQRYQRLRDEFIRLRARQECDHLIICGDFIHTPEGAGFPDGSWEILQDLMRLQQTYSHEDVIVLCGNHELPHIYDILFSRGQPLVYNASLEWAIANDQSGPGTAFSRAAVAEFLQSLPFYVVTRAGITVSHAGAPPFANDYDALEALVTFDHKSLLRLADDRLKHYNLKALRRDTAYRKAVHDNLAVKDPSDPRFVNLLRSEILMRYEPLMKLVWDGLFLENERGRGLDTYLADVDAFLAYMSQIADYPQCVLTTGHVLVRGGYQTVGSRSLRFASGIHAMPAERACYLLFDCDKPVQSAEDLIPMLRRVDGL